MKKLNLLILLVVLATFTACQTPQLGYFQDLKNGQVNELTNSSVVKIQPGDKLSILVSSKDPELAYLYNLPVVGHYQSSTSGKSLITSTISHYTVDQEGSIDFPYLGKIHIAGLTRSEIADLVKKSLINNNLLKDPSVTVDFLDMYFSVMGEVKTPGRFILDHDQVTILDALSRAGDLTIYGKRDNVLVLRTENNQQKSYRIDLSNAKDLYSSPAFYVQQNDMIYIEPNAKRANEADALGNAFASPSLWISAASLLTTICVLIFNK